MDKTSRTSWMRWIISYVRMFSLNPFCRLNLTTSCWVLLQVLFHLTSQAGCWGLGLAQLWIRKSFIPLHSRGNLGRRMAEESTPIQDSDRSASEDSFFCLFSFLIFAIFSRFALNDAGRSMVTALVARILEDPQLGDEQINLSWTTTVGEVCNDMPGFSQMYHSLVE